MRTLDCQTSQCLHENCSIEATTPTFGDVTQTLESFTICTKEQGCITPPQKTEAMLIFQMVETPIVSYYVNSLRACYAHCSNRRMSAILSVTFYYEVNTLFSLTADVLTCNTTLTSTRNFHGCNALRHNDKANSRPR